MEGNNPYRAPFHQGGGINAPFQPPNVNGYIQPRPRQTPQRPPEGASAAMPPRMPQSAPPAPAAPPVASPPNAAVLPPVSPGVTAGPQPPGAAPNYVMGGYQPRPLTLPDPEALAAKLNIDAYHVIRIEYFSLRFEPVLTIRDGNVTFNNCCIRGLDDAVWIHFLMGDEDDNTLVVRPRKEGTRGAVRWCVVKSDLRKSRSISCERLTTKLYRRMNWQKIYQYKLVGTRVPYRDEEVYVFFLDSAIPVAPGTVTPDGKRTPQRIIDPEEWANSYGPTVKELEASTQIDLEKGYTEELIMPRERTFRRDSTPDGTGPSATEAATQISMDEMTGQSGAYGPALASETAQPVWNDNGAEAPANEEVSV